MHVMLKVNIKKLFSCNFVLCAVTLEEKFSSCDRFEKFRFNMNAARSLVRRTSEGWKRMVRGGACSNDKLLRKVLHHPRRSLDAILFYFSIKLRH